MACQGAGGGQLLWEETARELPLALASTTMDAVRMSRCGVVWCGVVLSPGHAA